MEYLQTWLDNSEIPIITAFLLGLLTAVSPCPLATNITAIGFISKDINNRNRIFTNGVLYTLGRVLAYSGMAYTRLTGEEWTPLRLALTVGDTCTIILMNRRG